MYLAAPQVYLLKKKNTVPGLAESSFLQCLVYWPFPEVHWLLSDMRPQAVVLFSIQQK